MLIRTEAPADILAVDRLLKSVFETEAQAKLVMKLRENGRRSLSFVASTDDGEVVGYLLFSPVTLDGDNFNWQGLAPIAVKEEFRCQGIAKQLIEEGLASLHELGYPACVVLGDSAYYSRFGFVSAQEYNMRCLWDEKVLGAFQVKALANGEFDGRSGLIEYCPEFNQLESV